MDLFDVPELDTAPTYDLFGSVPAVKRERTPDAQYDLFDSAPAVERKRKPVAASSDAPNESPVGSDIMQTPHDIGIESLVSDAHNDKTKAPTNINKAKTDRLKRRRVSDKTAALIGISSKDVLQDKGSRDTHAECAQRQQDFLSQFKQPAKRTPRPRVVHSSSTTAAGAGDPVVMNLADMAKLKAVHDLNIDASTVPMEITKKWRELSAAQRRSVAMAGSPDAGTGAGAGAGAGSVQDAMPTPSTSASEAPIIINDMAMESLVKRLLKSMPPARINMSTDNHDTWTSDRAQEYLRDLRKNAVSLPIMEAATASQLLQEAGKWVVNVRGTHMQRNFPPCANGATCSGNTVGFMGKCTGTVMAWMSAAELQLFLLTSRVPVDIEKRICVLCYRRYVDAYYIMVMQCHTRIPNAPACFMYWSVRVGVKGGYAQAACMEPPDREDDGVAYNGFSCPFVRFVASHYITRRVNGRVVWDQSAIVERQTSMERIQPGQTLSRFLGRVELEQSLHVIGIQLVRNMTRVFHPVVCLAREFPARFVHIFPESNTLPESSVRTDFLLYLTDAQLTSSLQRIEARLAQLDPLQRPPDRTEWQYLKAVLQLYGDVRFGAWYERVVGKPMSPALRAHIRCNYPNIFSLNIDIRAHLMECVFWSAKPPGRFTPFVFMLNKLLAQPCSTRMFFKMLNDFVSTTPNADRLISNICFLGLLGTYFVYPDMYMRSEKPVLPSGKLGPRRTVPDTKALPDDLVFSLRCIQFEQPDLLNNIYTQVPLLALYSMRLLLYFSLRDQKCFSDQLRDSNYIAYAENVVNCYIIRYRYYIRERMPRDNWLKLLRPTASEEWAAEAERLTRAFTDIPRRMDLSEQERRRLMTEARRERSGMMFRLITQPVILAMSGAAHTVELLHLFCTCRRRRTQVIRYFHTSQWDKEPEVDIRIHKAMNAWLQHVGDRNIDPMELAQGLYHFPVNKQELNEIFATMHDFDMLRINARGLQFAMRGGGKTRRGSARTNSGKNRHSVWSLFERWPHTVAVVRLFSRVYSIHRRCAVFPLPLHVVDAQIAAVKRRWCLQPWEPVPEQEVYFVWCRVCQTIYNIYKSTPKSKTSVVTRKGRGVTAAAGSSTRTVAASKSNKQKRRKVSQRSAEQRRTPLQRWNTHTGILRMYADRATNPDDLIHHIGQRSLDTMIGKYRTTIVGIDTTKAFNAKHVLHAQHAKLGAVQDLQLLASIMRGDTAVPRAPQGSAIATLEMGLWEAEALQLNNAVMMAHAIGTPTATSGGPMPLRSANCKRQTGTGYGRWCCLVDLISGKQYCRVDTTRNGEQCIDKPLARTIALGQAVCMGRRLLTLCGSCGGMFAYTRYKCMYVADKGYVCMDCSTTLRDIQVLQAQADALGWTLQIPETIMLPLAVMPQEREETVTPQPLPVCVYCGTTLIRNNSHFSTVRVYDHGLMVCRKHGYALNVMLNERKEELQRMDKPTYRATIVECITNFVENRQRRVNSGRRSKSVNTRGRDSAKSQRELSKLGSRRKTGQGLAVAFIKRSAGRRSTQLQATKPRRRRSQSQSKSK